MSPVDILAFFGAVCVALLPFPQVITSWTRQRFNDISIISMSMHWIGCLIFTIYGILIRNGTIILASTLALYGSSILISLRVYYYYRYINEEPLYNFNFP